MADGLYETLTHGPVPRSTSRCRLSRQLARGAESAEVSRLAGAVGAATDPEESYLTAGNLSSCGETEAAAGMLKRAIDGNYCSYPAMESDPLFANLRARSEYAAIRAAGQTCQERFLAERARRR